MIAGLPCAVRLQLPRPRCLSVFVPAPLIRVRLTAYFFALPGYLKMTPSSLKSLVPWYLRDIQSLSRRALTKLLITSC